jgi:hypothetical protein
VKSALGYAPKAPKSWAAQDAEDVDRLAALAERHKGDDLIVGSALRIVARLKREVLPEDVEAEIDRLEAEDEFAGFAAEDDDETETGNDAERDSDVSNADLQTE